MLRDLDCQTVIVLGEYLELNAQSQHMSKPAPEWTPVQEVKSVNNVVSLVNETEEPVMVCKQEHIWQIHSITPMPDVKNTIDPPRLTTMPKNVPNPSSSAVTVDAAAEGSFSHDMRQKFVEVNEQ